MMAEPVQALADNPAPQLEAVFRRIADTRMAGLPFVNPALRVEAVGFRQWQGVWLGVLVTPWSINLLLLPAGGDAFRVLRNADMQVWQFPCGGYEFLGGHEEGVGHYQMCSLFSPALEFATHADAVATANAALDALFTVATASAQAESRAQVREAGRLAGQPLFERQVSRRAFLRGRFLRNPP